MMKISYDILEGGGWHPSLRASWHMPNEPDFNFRADSNFRKQEEILSDNKDSKFSLKP